VVGGEYISHFYDGVLYTTDAWECLRRDEMSHYYTHTGQSYLIKLDYRNHEEYFKLHITPDFNGGWLVIWKCVGAVFWLDSDLSVMKQLTSNHEFLPLEWYMERIHEGLKELSWGPYEGVSENVCS
jgi:hypothetical protein